MHGTSKSEIDSKGRGLSAHGTREVDIMNRIVPCIWCLTHLEQMLSWLALAIARCKQHSQTGESHLRQHVNNSKMHETFSRKKKPGARESPLLALVGMTPANTPLRRFYTPYEVPACPHVPSPLVSSPLRPHSMLCRLLSTTTPTIAGSHFLEASSTSAVWSRCTP